MPSSLDDKLEYARLSSNYIGDTNLYEDNRLLVLFNDGSILAFSEDECYVCDSLGRRGGKKPSKSKRAAFFVEV